VAEALDLLRSWRPQDTDPDRIVALNEASLELSPTALGLAFPRAQALLAAHAMELAERSQEGLRGAGPVSAQSQSNAATGASGSIGFGGFMDEGSRSLTQWGRELQAHLRRSVGLTVRVY
jgi:hypothetical protein